MGFYQDKQKSWMSTETNEKERKKAVGKYECERRLSKKKKKTK